MTLNEQEGEGWWGDGQVERGKFAYIEIYIEYCFDSPDGLGVREVAAAHLWQDLTGVSGLLIAHIEELV